MTSLAVLAALVVGCASLNVETPSAVAAVDRRKWIGYGATALALLPTGASRAAAEAEPSEAALARVRRGFEAFDARLLRRAEDLFTESIDEWRRLERPRQELMSLLVARANVRTDANEFAPAIADLDEALALMEAEGAKRDDGTPRFREYPDALVQRGLAHEGLKEWPLAIRDYDAAIALWGGADARSLVAIARAARSGGPLGLNPFALVYRGNAKASLREYDGALDDFRAAEALFAAVERNGARRDDVLANEALALYALGRADEAVAIPRRTVTRQPGLTDLHVLLAADAWRRGERETADAEWNFACNEISTGCRKYRDPAWLREIRRWPDVLVDAQADFLARRKV